MVSFLIFTCFLTDIVFIVRSQILSDNSLRIENVQVADDGVFVCRMENTFGSQEAEAHVTVLCKMSYCYCVSIWAIILSV